MLQDVLGVPNAINVLWTLSYEMLFYLLVVALFITARAPAVRAGLHRVRGGGRPVGGLLPMAALTRSSAVWQTVRADRSRDGGRHHGGRLAPPARTQRRAASREAYWRWCWCWSTAGSRLWEGLVILAVMFTGTASTGPTRPDQPPVARRCPRPLVLTCATWRAYGTARTGISPARRTVRRLLRAGAHLRR